MSRAPLLLPVYVAAMTQTIEKTGKRWKAIKAAGVLVMLVGLVMLPTESKGTGIALCVLGLGAVLVASVGAWWHHG